MITFDTRAFGKKICSVPPGRREIRVPVFRTSPLVAGLMETVPIDFRDIVLAPCQVDGIMRWAAYDESSEILYIGDRVEGDES